MEWMQQSSKHVVTGSLAGFLLLTQPASTAILAQTIQPVPTPVESTASNQSQMLEELSKTLPQQVEPLSSDTEDSIVKILEKHFNLPLSPALNSIRLNRNYGLIGKEQHLMRYPGDTINTHFATSEEAKFAPEGMAPGRGAWGYFADSREQMTAQDVQREKYYIAVPTFLSPTWRDNVKEHYAFFKYRKMLVVNPENGKAVVADIADAGPAEWTGKHLGGSPEVMDYLERQDGRARGPVLYFFIDDQNDTVPLGPIQIG